MAQNIAALSLCKLTRTWQAVRARTSWCVRHAWCNTWDGSAWWHKLTTLACGASTQEMFTIMWDATSTESIASLLAGSSYKFGVQCCAQRQLAHILQCRDTIVLLKLKLHVRQGLWRRKASHLPCWGLSDSTIDLVMHETLSKIDLKEKVICSDMTIGLQGDGEPFHIAHDQNHCMAQDSHKTFHRPALSASALQMCLLETEREGDNEMGCSLLYELELWRVLWQACYQKGCVLPQVPDWSLIEGLKKSIAYASSMLLRHHCLQTTASLHCILKGSKYESVDTWPYSICRHRFVRRTYTVFATPDRVPCKPCSAFVSAWLFLQCPSDSKQHIWHPIWMIDTYLCLMKPK